VIDGLKVGGDAGALFRHPQEGLAAPLGGHGDLVFVVAVSVSPVR